jgi:hypothetical protein
MSRRPFPKVKGIFAKRFRPTSEECERLIVDAWYTLCDRVRDLGPDSGYVAISTRYLHDLGIFLDRARRRERQVVL